MVEEQNDSGQSQQSQATPEGASQTTPSHSQETGGSGSDGGKTSTGLEPNLAALLAYLFGWISGLIFFLIEKDNKYVRFHALQSLLLTGAILVIWIALTILSFILSQIPVIGPLLMLLAMLVFWIGGLALWIILMVKAYQGEKFKLPVIGDIAEKNA